MLVDLEGAISLAGCLKYLSQNEATDKSCVVVMTSSSNNLQGMKGVIDRLSNIK